MLPACTLTIYQPCYSLDHHIHINQLILSLRFTPWIVLYPPVLSSAEAPAGFPNKNSNNRKIESARGTMGRGKRRERSFPFPSCPARSLFLSPQPPYNKKRPLRRREPPLYPQVHQRCIMKLNIVWYKINGSTVPAAFVFPHRKLMEYPLSRSKQSLFSKETKQQLQPMLEPITFRTETQLLPYNIILWSRRDSYMKRRTLRLLRNSTFP